MRFPLNPEILRLALGSLNAHRLRGGLTILGIVIGITSVTAMVSLVEGLNRSVQGQLANLGSDVIRVRRFDTTVMMGDLPDSLRNRRRFTEEDARGIRESCPSVLAVTTYTRAQETLRYRDRESRLTDVTGIDRDYLRVNSVGIGEGRPFTETEIRGGTRVVLVGAEVAEELFPGVDPVGREITVRDQRFRVTGVLAERGSFLGQSLDRQVLVPYGALERYFAGPRIRLRISARPVSPERVERAKEEMIESLRRTRGLRPADDNDFSLMTQENLLGLYKQITGAFFVVVVAIASVALLVGGIGVMNIMLVSVTERTREIGIRKALGASRRQILLQFLTEAVVLTGAGGILGLLLGLGVGVLVNAVTPLPAFVPPWAYAAAVGVSSGVGLFFGFWPAVRASRLHPVDALRYE